MNVTIYSLGISPFSFSVVGYASSVEGVDLKSTEFEFFWKFYYMFFVQNFRLDQIFFNFFVWNDFLLIKNFILRVYHLNLAHLLSPLMSRRLAFCLCKQNILLTEKNKNGSGFVFPPFVLRQFSYYKLIDSFRIFFAQKF